MAGGTVVHDARVIEHCIQESSGDMTHTAILRGG